ncbi:MSF1 domain-containing protein [Histoplasma capsulatum H143]|uniref:MSF1 domain-containing protein n=1 Tax=Ajellomyces capsulatus (strain H143) TaxID=544712 RepID=C6HPH5_AJECH|nr:MSF1 domain-containing protein [Histoplasma capsulatum H143]
MVAANMKSGGAIVHEDVKLILTRPIWRWQGAASTENCRRPGKMAKDGSPMNQLTHPLDDQSSTYDWKKRIEAPAPKNEGRKSQLDVVDSQHLEAAVYVSPAGHQVFSISPPSDGPDANALTMKFFESTFNYDYSFPAVSLAYFLRYPNPYSRHVLTTDVIDRYVDPVTERLHTTRLLLKKSKIPSAMLKLLPKGIGGSENSGQSFILETTVVDVKEGWMHTESRNMEWTGILSVVEKQLYRRLPPSSDNGQA